MSSSSSHAHGSRRRRPKARRSRALVSQSAAARRGTVWTGLTRVPRMIVPDNQTFITLQQYPALHISCTTATTNFGVTQFQMSNLDGFTALGAVFDQYKVLEIAVTYRPDANTNPVGGSAGSQLITVTDYDDGTSPTGLAYLNQYANVQTTEYEMQQRRFVPHVAPALYTGSFNGYGNIPCPWIDSASNNVVMYGTKWGIQNYSAATVYYSVTSTLKIAWKNVH
jgi:hypothetical protein